MTKPGVKYLHPDRVDKRFIDDGIACASVSPQQLIARDSIRQKLQTGQYYRKRYSCPSCHSSSVHRLSDKDKYGLPHKVGICTQCGLVYGYYRLSDDCLTDFYKNHFTQLDVGFNQGPELSFNDQYQNAKYAVAPFLNGILPEKRPLNILEVGCSTGGALLYFQELGHTVTGLDLDRESLNYGVKEYGLNLIETDLPLYTTDLKYDLIIYHSVFEHISSPRAHLQKISKLLSNSGILYIRVPGVKSIHRNSFHRYDLLDFITTPHLYYFSLTSLQNLVSQYSLRLVKANETVFAAFQLSDAKSIVEHESDYASVLSYLNRINSPYLSIFKYKLFLVKRSVILLLSSIGVLPLIKSLANKLRSLKATTKRINNLLQ